jgi:hypothetical protein
MTRTPVALCPVAIARGGELPGFPDHVLVVVVGAAAGCEGGGSPPPRQGVGAAHVGEAGVGRETGKNRGCELTSQPRFFPVSTEDFHLTAAAKPG